MPQLESDGQRRQSRVSPLLSGVPGARLFPIRPFACCPLQCIGFIPETVKTIQDYTHLILLIGTFASTFIVFSGVSLILGWRTVRDPFAVVRIILTLIFVAPCMFYFIQIIGRYDGNLQAKQLQAEAKREELKANYKESIKAMDGLLGKSNETSAGLAERTFEEKRRGFIKFLERVRSRNNDLFIGLEGDPKDFHKQLNRFILCWLRVFQECSIDPVDRPLTVVSEEELDRCASASDSVSLVLDRLKVSEVRFVKDQHSRDQRCLQKLQTACDKHKRVAALFGRQAHSAQLGLIISAWRMYAVQKKSQREAAGGRPAREVSINSLHMDEDLEVGRASTRRTCGVTWLRLGAQFLPEEVPTPLDDGFPRVANVGCGSIMVLSPSHAKLVAGFVAGGVCLLLNIFMDPSFLDFLVVLSAQTCIVMVLLRFEELDEVQRLAVEVSQLEQEAQAAQERHEKMTAFWQNAQQLTELWLHRTVPRLELIAELHKYIEDAKTQHIGPSLRGMTIALHELESGMGPLEAWRVGGQLTEQQKKDFSAALGNLYRDGVSDGDMQRMLQQLPDLAQFSLENVSSGTFMVSSPKH